MTIIYFILILGITILIHEFGHFIFAKKFGVHVYEFSLGMGPRLFKFNRKNDETDYSIRLFPIGGYVQMAGESIEVDESIPKESRLNSKPIYQRCLIMVAGVMMNFLLAIVIFFFIGLFNTVSLNNVYVSHSAYSTIPNGSRITSINNHFTNNYDKLALELTIVSDKEFDLVVKDKDESKRATISPIKVGKSNLLYGYDYGFTLNDLSINKTSVDTLKKGYKIVNVDGIQIKEYNSLLVYLNSAKKDEYTFQFQDEDNNIITYNANVKTIDNDELIGYAYGFNITGTEEKGLLAAIKYAFVKFFSTLEQMFFTIIYLINGTLSVKLLSGPVGIFNAVSIYSQYGFTSILSLLCLICINVGFINILPLPAFDGGHVVFLLIEKITGKPVNPKVENTIHTVGLIVLMILMVLITYNDITRLF